LGRWIDSKLKFALLAKFIRQFLHEQRREAGASAAAKRVEHEETLFNNMPLASLKISYEIFMIISILAF
jgi:hypothetical protein